MPAGAGDGEVVGVDLEAVTGQDAGLQLVEQGGVGLDDAAAGLADEVLVGDRLVEVPRGRPVPEVGVVGDAELLEAIQTAVDGGLVDLGVPGMDVGGELFRGAVLAGAR